MKGLYRQNFALIKTNFSALIWFELLYKMLAALVLYPLILLLLDYAIEKSGLTFLTDKNITTFVSDPVSLSIGIFLIVLIVIFALYELSVLTICFEKSRVGEKVNAIEIAFAGLTKMRCFFHPVGFLFFFVLLAAVTFLDFPFASALVSITGIPDFLHNTFRDHRVLYFVVTVVSAVVLWFFWSYIFAIHFIVLREKNFKEAMASTRKMIRGHSVGMNIRFLIWYLIVFAVLLIFYALVLLAGASIIKLAYPTETELVAFLGFSRVTGNVASFILYNFFTPIFFVVVSSYFQKITALKTEKSQARQPQLTLRPFKSHRAILGLILAVMIGANVGILARSISNGVIRQLVFARTPEITAHRGSSANAPENTLAAIEKAIEDGADYAEIDVRLTADGNLVLMHDASLERTAGSDEMIWNARWEYLRNLDAGSYFSSEYTGERIPSLEEVMDAASGRIRLNIEIKYSSHTPDLARKVAELIVEKDYVDRCVITSFKYDVLADVKAVSPDIKTGLIVTMPLGRYTALNHVDFYSLSAVFLSARQADMIHRLGYEIHVWGAKDEQTIRRMVEYGADNIIATDPVLAREAVYTHSANELVIRIAELFFGRNETVRRTVSFFPGRYG
ncbi:MAG: glycerophosphodiester phosphodiesterase family protein [Oscillospiraceae bacterium]|nr:glycerophosphodiester phosphodiesterase family protein [Oscillospiraceae bacterium]